LDREALLLLLKLNDAGYFAGSDYDPKDVLDYWRITLTAGGVSALKTVKPTDAA
jgi:hypothetical protein